MDQQNSKVEIVLHINDTLDEDGRTFLTTMLEKNEAIHSAEFCPLHHHLMLVQYDRNRVNSQEILQTIRDQDLYAQLIGPI